MLPRFFPTLTTLTKLPTLPMLLLAGALLAPPSAPAWAQEGLSLEAHADLQNLVLYRNDADFDRTPPYYDASGQTEGTLATVFRPDVTFRMGGHLRIFYQAELGLNYWGKNSPDQESFSAGDVFVMKHRQVFGEGELGPAFFRVGYSEFQDATGLFLHHWTGVAQAGWRLTPSAKAEVFFGQVPDQVYEGINVTENNFTRDILIWGATGRYAFTESLSLTFGLASLFDSHVVGQIRRVYCPHLELEGKRGGFSGWLDLALQAGRFTGTALGGGSQDQLAWALQARAQYEHRAFQIQLNAMALSGDDDYDGNSVSRAFLYSGKSKSATLFLTEDEIRNWYDSLDLRMSGFRDGFYTNRAGLFVADVKATWHATEGFHPAVIVGVASTLNPHNSLGKAFVGVETDLLLQYRFSEHLLLQAVVGGLFPGPAGAALVNRIDLGKTDPVVSVEGSFLIHY